MAIGYHCLGRAPWVGPAFVCRLDGAPIIVHRCQGKGPPWDKAGFGAAPHLPDEARAAAHLERYHLGPGPAEDAAAVFARIYRRGTWGHGDRSGGGSTDREAPPYLELVNGLLRLAGARRVVDLGCGDGAVTRGLAGWTIPLAPIPRVDGQVGGMVELAGVDCYDPHLQRLRLEAPQIAWLHLDLDRDRDALPSGDVALLKDTLHHWPNALLSWLAWARAAGKWRWLVLTYDCANATAGADCPLGGYRPLSALMPPLADCGVKSLTRYLHKEVALLQCDAALPAP